MDQLSRRSDGSLAKFPNRTLLIAASHDKVRVCAYAQRRVEKHTAGFATEYPTEVSLVTMICTTPFNFLTVRNQTLLPLSRSFYPQDIMQYCGQLQRLRNKGLV